MIVNESHVRSIHLREIVTSKTATSFKKQAWFDTASLGSARRPPSPGDNANADVRL